MEPKQVQCTKPLRAENQWLDSNHVNENDGVKSCKFGAMAQKNLKAEGDHQLVSNSSKPTSGSSGLI